MSSTPICDIPDDIDLDDEEIEEEPVARAPKLPSKGGKNSNKYFMQYKEYIFLFIAALLALRIPFASFAYNLPQQVFMFGDGPIRAILIVLVYIILKQLKNFVSF